MRVKLREGCTQTSHLLQVDSIAKQIIQEVMVGARPKPSVIQMFHTNPPPDYFV